jgi:hypothetical protein
MKLNFRFECARKEVDQKEGIEFQQFFKCKPSG